MALDEGWAYEAEPNDTAGWQELDTRPLATQGDTVLFRVFGNRFKSSSSDAERFIHDPLGEMVKAPLLEVTPEFTVTTIVVRHELQLRKHPMIVLVLIAHATATAVVTIYKAP